MPFPSWFPAESADRYWVAGIIVATVCIYLPFVGHPFTGFDDGMLITENETVHEISLRSVEYVFTSYDPELYVPLTLLSYQITYALVGAEPFLYHFTNLLLHIGSAVLLFFIVRTLTKGSVIAGVTAFLFAIHPINVEAVLWASARKDVLSAFFFLWSWWLYLRYAITDSRTRYWQSVFVFVLALLSKVSVLVLPAVLLLSDWVQYRRIDRQIVYEKLPYAGLSVIFAIVAVMGKVTNLAALSTMEQLLLACKSAVFYLEKILLPSGFSLLYSQTTPITLRAAEFLIPLITIVLLLLACVMACRRARLISFALALFFLALLPSMATFYKNGFIFFASDRYAYIACIGIFLCAGLLVYECVHRGRVLGIAAVGLTSILLIVCGVLASVQARVWQSPKALFQNVLNTYPLTTLAHHTLGYLHEQEGEWTQAQAHFEQAIAIDAAHASSYVSLAKHAAKEGDKQAVEDIYKKMHEQITQKAVWSRDDANGLSLYALFLEEQGRLSEAIVLYEQAATQAPLYFQTQSNIGIKYQQIGRSADALHFLELAAELDPRSADTHYRLAALYAESGQLEEAEASLKRVLKLDPSHAKARQHLDAMQHLDGI